MPSVSTDTASGQGTLSLGGQHDVSEIAWKIITPADYATLTGLAPFRRVHRQGSWAIGYTAADGPFGGIVLLTQWGFIDTETRSIFFDITQNRSADTLYFDIFLGGVMYLEADWA